MLLALNWLPDGAFRKRRISKVRSALEEAHALSKIILIFFILLHNLPKTRLVNVIGHGRCLKRPISFVVISQCDHCCDLKNSFLLICTPYHFLVLDKILDNLRQAPNRSFSLQFGPHRLRYEGFWRWCPGFEIFSVFMASFPEIRNKLIFMVSNAFFENQFLNLVKLFLNF